MRRYTISIAFILGACGASGPERDQSVDVHIDTGWAIDVGEDLNTFFECLEDDGATLISAHRGGPYPGYPENALETFDHLLQDIPAILEIDVATSRDGVLFLMHDDTLDRTTTGAGATNALDWKDIRTLKLIDNSGKPTAFRPTRLDDALRWANGRTLLQIDFKRTTRFEDVVAEVHRQDAEQRIIYIAYSLAQAEKLHRLDPSAMISLSVNSMSDINRSVAAGVPTDKIIGFTGTDAPRPRLFNILTNRDVEVIFGTLGGRDSIDSEIEQTGEEDRYVEIAKLGADILATDRPLKAQYALNKDGRGATNGVCGVTKR